MKTITRKQLAYYAGVCPRTLRNWMDAHEEELRRIGKPEGNGALPPIVCEWIIKNYGITVDEKGKK
jgi:hypothetical protein